MICKTCGSELPSGSDLCPICGAWNIPIESVSGAVLTDEEHLALESQALKSPIERDLEEFAKAYMRELEGSPLQELEELVVEYPLPTLPVELLPEPERSAGIGWLAGTIDADGRVDEGRFGKDQIGRIDLKIYRWEWIRPRVRLASTTLATIDKFDELIGAHARWTEERPPPYLPYHYAEVSVSKAIKLLILCEPYFVKWKQKARQLIEKYRKHPEIRIR